ncbi:MAG: hypothetical protein WBJ10_06575 [Daejeonella sp.]|uniref:hypothetical protein n=1 Tax=Daejeonella sp. TaxID=2805397 RepID=UPI003C790023
MNRLKSFSILFIAIILSLTSCKNETSINESDASDVITAHLESNPEYKTTTFKFGELKFHSRKDREELKLYEELAEKGLIQMKLDEQMKVFLSKDSTYVYQVTLSEKAASLVLEQSNSRATVKAVNYILDDDKPVNFEQSNDKTAKATVSLKIEPTDFYPFLNKESDSDFITKTYS